MILYRNDERLEVTSMLVFCTQSISFKSVSDYKERRKKSDFFERDSITSIYISLIAKKFNIVAIVARSHELYP